MATSGEDKGPVFESDAISVKPVPRQQVPPKYPLKLRRAGIQGEATIDFVVDENGQPQNVRVVKATHAEFGKAAAEAVSQWTFSPGMKDGKAVRTRMQVPLVFSLSYQ